MSNFFPQGGTNAWGARSGIHPGGGDRVTNTGMTVNVLDYKGIVHAPITSTVGVKLFYGTAQAFVVPTAHASLTRVDKVYARVWDTDIDGDGLYKADTVYLTGTAGSGAPSLPASKLVVQMATITLTGGSTSPTVVYDAPMSSLHSGILPGRTASEFPTLGLYEGMYADDAALNKLMRYSGSAWEEIARVPTVVTGGYTAATGWSTSALSAVVTTGPIVTGVLSMNRTGGDLTYASGNVSPDLAVATLPASLFPLSTAYASCGNGDGFGECSISTAGVVSLRSWAPTNSLTSANAALRIVLSYRAAA
ncbi:hypothetical protein AB0I28_12650 [Phytomonospora sp. NPDC050363]|uniref:hypothetical protein n=1 Tax=Phytomonospora sp. NPDC050363 TaxID=3155642 RepID=UPI0033E0BD74